MASWSRVYSVLLLAGALAFGVAGLVHPILLADAPGQLAIIAGTARWHLIHWTLLFSLPLMLAGLVGFAAGVGTGAGMRPAIVGGLVAVFGFAILALNILFMAGAGALLAASPTPEAVLIYGMLHPSGLAAERLATMILGIAIYLLGRAALLSGVRPRWLAQGGLGVGTISALVPVFTSEQGLAMYYCQGLLVAWMVVAGTFGLVRPPES